MSVIRNSTEHSLLAFDAISGWVHPGDSELTAFSNSSFWLSFETFVFLQLRGRLYTFFQSHGLDFLVGRCRMFWAEALKA